MNKRALERFTSEVEEIMAPIDKPTAQAELEKFSNQDVYIHLETTTGAYASAFDENVMTICAFIRNACIRFEQGSIAGDGPYRVGLKMEHGWVYAEGLTDFEVVPEGSLLFAGHDTQGRLAVSLELGAHPFTL